MRDPLVIDMTPQPEGGKALRWLRGRRLMLAGILALAEVVAFLIWRPSALLMATAAVVLLVACVAIATRIGPGVPRTLLWIVAIAQGIVVIIPLVVGLSLVAGLVIAVALIVALIAVAARWRM
ncbi:MAG: hypothetical protein AB7V42_05470 [Thermoleophilia bacterium]